MARDDWKVDVKRDDVSFLGTGLAPIENWEATARNDRTGEVVHGQGATREEAVQDAGDKARMPK